MMRCLDKGGIKAYYDVNHIVKEGTNKYGSYEVPLSESKGTHAYDTRWQSMFNHPGRAVKILCHKMMHVPALKPYRVIIMLRDPNHIYKSYMRAWGKQYTWVMKDAEAIKKPGTYHKLMIDLILKCHSMENIEFVTMSYDQVVQNPLKQFKLIEALSWEIDAEKAVEGVDAEEKHF